VLFDGTVAHDSLQQAQCAPEVWNSGNIFSPPELFGKTWIAQSNLFNETVFHDFHFSKTLCFRPMTSLPFL
jgi:hypothetical protein